MYRALWKEATKFSFVKLKEFFSNVKESAFKLMVTAWFHSERMQNWKLSELYSVVARY